MLKIGIIGAGSHSTDHHLPALAHYRDQYPGAVELSALCDLDLSRARRQGAKFSVARCYGSADEMLDGEKLDGVMVITPPEATLAVMRQVLCARVPVLIEKPPGATVEQAKQVAEAAESSGIGVMVSVNRRFDPIIAAGKKWLGNRAVQYLRCTFVRHARTEPGFFTATAIHATDTMRYLAGEREVTSASAAPACGGQWRIATVTFADEIRAVMEILPTAGGNAETYEVFGEGFRVVMRSPFFDAGELLCYENGRLAHRATVGAAEPLYIRSGTYAETQAFLDALAGRRPYAPAPRQIVASLELAYAISETIPCKG